MATAFGRAPSAAAAASSASLLLRRRPGSAARLPPPPPPAAARAASSSCLVRRRPRPFRPAAAASSGVLAGGWEDAVPPGASLVQRPRWQQQHQRQQQTRLGLSLLSPPTQQQARFLSTRGKGGGKKGNRKGPDDGAPLINEHLIAELFNLKRKDGGGESPDADTYEVRLSVDRGFRKDDEDHSDGGSGSEEEESKKSRVVTLSEALSIAQESSLDLVEVSLRASPPVILAVDHDRWSYAKRKREREKNTKKRLEGTGAISDKALKEFKFRAGIADHDLKRKASSMASYLEKGHAVRVTLTARRRMLEEDADAIDATFVRVKELVGDLAVEARGMKANDRKSFGTLLLHPSKAKG
ncbi:hypothetical protein ACHAWF_018514 [Thalassiosira exigua]